MSSDRQPPLSLVRHLVVVNLARPLPEFIDQALICLNQALDARAAFYARIDGHSFEIMASDVQSGAPIERGLRMALEDTFAAVDEEMEGGVLNIRDASKRQPFKSLAMRQRLGITSYLGTSFPARGEVTGTVGVIGKGPRIFTETDQDLLLIVAGLLAPRLHSESRSTNGQARTPVAVVRLASEEVKEPLAILRGYADMLANDEIPADQMQLLSRLPLELAFTVRISLGAVVESAAQRIRDRMSRAGMELRLQLDTEVDVWGDATLLEAALDEMLHNVFKHARSATVVQLRLRQTSGNRYQLIVKDDGPGMSADRLEDLFGPLADDQPLRGQGLGLYLLRRVAEAHGGRAWANSLEGKGTTFYLELPAASPDGDSARASAASGATA